MDQIMNMAAWGKESVFIKYYRKAVKHFNPDSRDEATTKAFITNAISCNLCVNRIQTSATLVGGKEPPINTQLPAGEENNVPEGEEPEVETVVIKACTIDGATMVLKEQEQVTLNPSCEIADVIDMNISEEMIQQDEVPQDIDINLLEMPDDAITLDLDTEEPVPDSPAQEGAPPELDPADSQAETGEPDLIIAQFSPEIQKKKKRTYTKRKPASE